jgi:hypothetical protein
MSGRRERHPHTERKRERERERERVNGCTRGALLDWDIATAHKVRRQNLPPSVQNKTVIISI